MKKYIFLILITALVSCLKNTVEIEPLKYDKDDLVPLNDSTKTLYYNDAAYIEFNQLIQDTTKRCNQIKLEEQNIISYYNDLINIYNHCYSISNSFFENISSIHTFYAQTLYYLTVSVDTSKVWVEEWLNGNMDTGIAGIDSLIANYVTEILFIFESQGGYTFRLKTNVPINYFALKDKLEKTAEFRYIEPEIMVGESNHISFTDGNQKIYQYTIGWGDCPSGCIYHYHWKIKVTDQVITLLEEYGDPLK